MVLTVSQHLRDGGSGGVCALRGACFIQQEPAHGTSTSCCHGRVKPNGARLWDFFFEKCQNMNYVKSLDFKMLAHCKKTHNTQNTQIKQNTSAAWVWQLGHQFATCDRDAEICIMYLGDCGWAVGLEQRGSPMEKSVMSLDRERGSRLWIILNVILLYPFWRRKCFQFAVHFFLL